MLGFTKSSSVVLVFNFHQQIKLRFSIFPMRFEQAGKTLMMPNQFVEFFLLVLSNEIIQQGICIFIVFISVTNGSFFSNSSFH